MSSTMSSTSLRKIAVLVSVGSHPVSDTKRYSRNDAAALALAFALRRQPGIDHVDVIHAGDPANTGLQDYLALGAETVVVLPVADGGDVLSPLLTRLQGYDLVLCGSRAEGGEQSGCLPYLLAQHLGRPLLAGVIDAQWSAGTTGTTGTTGTITARQFLPKGRRRDIAVDGPAVLTVHPLAPCALRYAYARRCAGRIAVDCGLQQERPPAGNDWTVTPARARPVRLVAQEKRSGHARMQSATVTESRGGKVVAEGSAADKARAVLTYLREHRLIDY